MNDKMKGTRKALLTHIRYSGQKSLFFLLFLSFLLIAAGPVCSWAEILAPAFPKEKDRCPVCGMFVTGYPNWLAQLRYSDNKLAFFDGVKDLMKYYFQISKYEKDHSVKDIRQIYVTDYYSTDLIPAFEAWFVIGSDVLGPMGHELIPHRSRDLAEEFMMDHQGNSILTFQEITPELIDKL